MAYLRYPPYSKIPEIDDRFELLFYCIRFALYAALPPLDRYLKNILTPADYRGYCGGDPDWEIDGCEDDGRALFDESGQRIFRCWALSDISDIEPETAYYTVEEVRYYIRVALDNIAVQYPNRFQEVQEVITRYGL